MYMKYHSNVLYQTSKGDDTIKQKENPFEEIISFETKDIEK